MNTFEGLNVSRETSDRLEAFVALVEKWTPKINLISKSSVADIRSRHILDSAQVYEHAPKHGHWMDIGSGGGFPGVVVAILSLGEGADHRFTLVESDQRKCAFLRTASRELGLGITVHSERIEALPPQDVDVLSARALADLKTLLTFAHQHLKSEGVAIFPKGETWLKEHEAAQTLWSYRCEPIKSETNAAAAVLKIQEINRV